MTEGYKSLICNKCGASTINTENLILFEGELDAKKDICNDCVFLISIYLKQKWSSRENKQVREEHARLLREQVQEELIKPDD